MTFSSFLFEPVSLGSLSLKNRIIMAPMTRSRANSDGSASALMVEYYRQRARAGLIVTEGVYPSEQGKGYNLTPGIASQVQADAWRKVVDAVHAEGGKVAIQLMHCGRISHPFNHTGSASIVAPSALVAKGEIYTNQGLQAYVEPDVLSCEGVQQVINDYRRATERAFDVGFDAVELHCTSGYLPAQFLSTGTNRREDQYGGGVNNRCRFVIELIQAMAGVNGADKIGCRICPANPYNDLYDKNPKETFDVLLEQLSEFNLAYLHAIQSPDKAIDVIGMATKGFSGRLVINDGFDQCSAEKILADGNVSAVSFGRHFIANPDLVWRMRQGVPLSDFDRHTLYSGGKKGYTDYLKSNDKKS